jgi:uncharacterized membrane protein YiaA
MERKIFRMLNLCGMLFGVGLMIIGVIGGFIPGIVIGFMATAIFVRLYYGSLKRKADEKEIS